MVGIKNRNPEYLSDNLKNRIRKSTILAYLVGAVIAAGIELLTTPSEDMPIYQKAILALVLAGAVVVGWFRSKKSEYIDKKPALTIIINTVLLSIALIFVAKVESPFTFLYLMPIFLASVYYNRKTAYFLLAIAAIVLVIQPVVFHWLVTEPLFYDPDLDIEDYINNVITFILLVISSLLIIDSTLVPGEDRNLMQMAMNNEIEQRKKLVSLVEGMKEAVIAVESNGDVNFSNSAFKNMFNIVEDSDALNINRIIDFNEENSNFVDYIRQASQTDETDTLYLNTDKEKLIVAVEAQNIQNADYSDDQFLVVLRDITVEKTIEEDQKNFISLLSHELRTPLAQAEAEVSTLPVLIEKGEDSTKIKRFASSAQQHILDLSVVAKNLDDFVTLNGVGDNTIKDHVNISKLLDKLHETYEDAASKKNLSFGIEVKHTDDSWLEVNENYLESILNILVNNAIKFTENGSVNISYNVEGDKAIFRVDDTGLGIPSSVQKELFSEGFIQAEDYSTRTKGGLGIGLYIAKRTADRINADLSVESTLGEGSTFTVSVPK